MITRAKVFIWVAFLLPGPGLAGMISTDDVAPYELCALCHSLDGNSRMSKFPKLAGQPAAYIEKQVHDFLAGARTNDGGQMASIVTELAPEDIPVVAEWFAAQPAPAPFEETDTAEGAKLFDELGCLSCHRGEAQDAPTPYLTAQHPAYLAKQMRDYRDGERSNDLGAVMQSVMQDIGDAQIDAMARYLAATPRGTDGDS